MLKLKHLLLPALLLATSITASQAATPESYLPLLEKTTKPTKVKTQIYGYYSRGCIDGAVAIADDKNFHLVRAKSRGRFYGHPTLKDFLYKYTNMVIKKTNKILLISDLSNPRGGPFLDDSSHISHQTGLDVDIWYLAINKHQISDDLLPIDLLEQHQWSDTQDVMLKEAAKFPEVQRILVNPKVKRYLCEQYSGEPWLYKIRPWFGHNDHFHIRLHCPNDSPYCDSQDEVAKTDGCDASLDWWFSDEARQMAAEPTTHKLPNLPDQCMAVFGR